MELILLPFIFVLQITVHLLMAIVGFVFNLMFRRNRSKLFDEDATFQHSIKPENPWEVFGFSLLATAILASITAGIFYYIWETTHAATIGFIVVGVLGLFSSITAATGEVPPM